VMEFDWRDIGAIMAASSLIGGAGIAYVRYRLSGDFAKTSDVRDLGVRMQVIEAKIGGMPSHDDMRILTLRVGDLDRNVAVASANIAGALELMHRVEHQTSLLLENELSKQRKAQP
jgi:hypothetical protein